ncbi:MAG: hypothetical protein JWM88_3231 [Verrucomicrobia bacterium]|nr:hypothetical protein [Verrucomicrobiota bacterium]
MDLSAARQLIQSSFDRMRALYLKPVFDEWVVLTPGARHAGVLAYSGPRLDEFREKLPSDVEPLAAQLAGRNLPIGDFEFTHEGDGTRHDALIRLGATSYLVCNNLAKSMAEIRSDPRWLKAQAAFVDLSERFRSDPLEA